MQNMAFTQENDLRFYRQILRFYEVSWQKYPNKRTRYIQEHIPLPRSVIKRIDEGRGYPNLVLTDKAKSIIQSFVLVAHTLPCSQRQVLGNALIKNQTNNRHVMQNVIMKHFTEEVSDEIFSFSFSEMVSDSYLLPKRIKNQDKLLRETTSFAEMTCVLLPEDLQFVSSELSRPNTFKGKCYFAKEYAVGTAKNIGRGIKESILGLFSSAKGNRPKRQSIDMADSQETAPDLSVSTKIKAIYLKQSANNTTVQTTVSMPTEGYGCPMLTSIASQRIPILNNHAGKQKQRN